MDSIRVGVRVRPLLKRENDAGLKNSWTVSSNCITHKVPNAQSYCFDNVFHGDVKTTDIFSTMALPIVHSVMEGFNGTIFVYGQTSSGKTHTMMGTSEDPGIVPLTIHEIFSYIEQCVTREFILRLSYLEIYNETLTDLLNPENKSLKIRENTEHTVSVHGLTECAVTLASEVVDLLCYGDQNRVTGETNMNERSSRSHTIVTMAIESRERDEEEEGGGGKDGPVKVSSINLVDLAGSERVSTNGVEWTNVRFKEGTFINLSLLTLGNVIAKLSEGSSAHIPFRDSKLTRILQPSLGGNARTCIVCTITPASVEETHSTLKFASRAKQIQNKPIINEVLLGEAALVKKLKSYQKENDELKHKLAERLPEEEKAKLTLQLADSEKEKSELEQKIRSLQDIIVRSSVTEALNPLAATARDRRRTVCPALLTRAAQDVPRSLVHPTISTPASSRHTLEMFSPLFTPHFDKTSFEKHLDSLDVTPVAIDKKHVKFASRPSFIPNLRCANLELSDGLETTAESSHAAGGMTAVCGQMVNTSAQTEILSTSVGTTPIHCGPSTSCVPNLNASFLCEHRQKLQSAMETLEIAQFECDENHIVLDHLKQENAKLQADNAEMKTTLDIHVNKSSSQEEMINNLQHQLAIAEMAVQDKQSKIDQFERECHVMSSEVNEWKLKLESFKKAVEKGGQQECNSAVRTLQTELEAVKCKAVQDESHFQVCYEQKVQEVNRMNLKVSALEEKLQDAYAELLSYESKVKELSRVVEETKPKMQQYTMVLEEKDEMIYSLQNAVIAANKKTEEETKKIRTQYEGYLSQTESYARDLQAKLSERASSPESSTAKLIVANLKADVQELQSKYEEKTAAADALQAKVDELNSILQLTKDQLEEKLSESTVINRSATPRRLAAVSFEEEAADYAREEEMLHLSEQLKVALEDKEAAATAQEQKLKELNCLLDNKDVLLKEKEATVSSQEQQLSELQQQLESARKALEDKEAAANVQEHRVMELSCLLDNKDVLLKEKEATVSGQEQQLSELQQQLESAMRILEDKEAGATVQEKALEEVRCLLDNKDVLLKEKEATVSGQEQQLSELQQQLESARKALEELKSTCEKKIEEQAAVLTEKEIALASQEESMKILTSQIENITQSKRMSQESSELQHMMHQMKEKEATILKQEQRLLDLQSELESHMAALEGKENTCLYLEKCIEELNEKTALLQEEASLVNGLQTRMKELSSLLHSTRDELEVKQTLVEEQAKIISDLSSQLHTAQQESMTSAVSLQSRVKELTDKLEVKQTLVEEQAKKISDLSSQLHTAQQESMTSAVSLQSRVKELTDKLEERMATCSLCEKKIIEYEATLTALQTQLDKSTKRGDDWEMEYKKKSDEADELCQVERQLMDEISGQEAEIVALKSKLESVTADFESMKRLPELLKTAQRALEEKTLHGASLQSRVNELKEELEGRKVAYTLCEKRIVECEATIKVLQTQLVKATECGNDWEAEYKKKSEEVDDLCRAEKQLLDEKDELLLQISKLKSKPKEIECSKQEIESYQSQINDLKSSLQSSRNEMETQLAKATERGDVWEEEYKKKSEEVDELCQVERQLMDQNYELETQINALRSKLELAENDSKKVQQVVPSTHAISSSEEYSYKARIQELQKDNEYLRSKLQSEALKPVGCGASSSVANDGSGFVTGVAYYEMQGSKRAVERENEKLIAKSEKLKAENASLQTLLQKEREEVKRYRNERNVYRVKYEKLKECSPSEKKDEPVVVAADEPVEENLEAAPEKLPTPRRTRKSILSFPTTLNTQRSHDCLKTEANIRSSNTTGKEKVVQFEDCTVPTSVKSTLSNSMPVDRSVDVVGVPPLLTTRVTQESSQLVMKDATACRAATATAATQNSIPIKRERDVMPDVDLAKMLVDGPTTKAVQRQPLTNMNTEQATKRKDEDKGHHRKSILSFPPDSNAVQNPYTSKKAKFEEDLTHNPQPSTADPSECKAQ